MTSCPRRFRRVVPPFSREAKGTVLFQQSKTAKNGGSSYSSSRWTDARLHSRTKNIKKKVVYTSAAPKGHALLLLMAVLFHRKRLESRANQIQAQRRRRTACGLPYLGYPEAPLAADLPATLDALVAPPPGRLAQVVHHRLQQVHEEHCPEQPAGARHAGRCRQTIADYITRQGHKTRKRDT